MEASKFVESSPLGDCFEVKGEWKNEYAEYMKANNIVCLNINYVAGFVGTKIDFLAELPFLKSLFILTYWVDDITPIEELSELRSLSLNRTGKKGINFSRLPKLESLELEWRPRSETLLECSNLIDLRLSHYLGHGTTAFSPLINLKSLKLQFCPVSNLIGLSSMTKLKSLELSYLTKLTSLQGIQNLVSIEELEIDSCKKIKGLDEVANLTNLKKIYFDDCGDIPTLKVLSNLKNLKQVLFSKSTNILDGNLTHLAELPKLKSVGFRNRKHYTHTRGQLDSSWDEP